MSGRERGKARWELKEKKKVEMRREKEWSKRKGGIEVVMEKEMEGGQDEGMKGRQRGWREEEVERTEK